ncbi:MAG TPA: hypothetical protein VEG38_21070, partial [Acidimicrobiia bacterium]|nr:hypothetical protein [Acidimicrobiia bacterium]
CAGNSTWWCDVVRHGREIVESYDTEVGLRQTHYRLMSNRSDYVNSRYNGLSSQTAMPRRIKTFPRLLDSTRQINRPLYWEDADDAKEWLKRQFRVDRTRNQDVAIYIALEKRGLIAQFDAWFSQPFGIPVIPLGGVSSESIERDTIEDVIRDATEHENRRRVLLAGGDFDASGEFIGQNYARFVGRYFDRIIRVTLTADQVEDLDLPVVPGSGVSETTGRCKNSLWPAFRDKYWDLLCQQSDRHPEVDWDPRTNPEHAGQVEMDALDPNYLRDLFQEAIYDAGWSDDAYQAALAEEEEEREDI